MKLMRANILIAEDESNIRLMLRTALESEGYEVDEAANGREALAAIARRLPDLMLLDLNMPVLDGMGVLEQLQTFTPDQKPRVIVLTAYGSIPAAVKAMRLGAADFVEKPVTPEELRETVAAVLADTHAAPAADVEQIKGGYEGVLGRVRKALRLADFATAETLLMKAEDLKELNAAPYFNLLGVLYEAQRNWRLARKFYGKAIRAKGDYAPAQQNMRRLYELNTFGHTNEAVALGDELEDVWFARLPEAKERR